MPSLLTRIAVLTAVATASIAGSAAPAHAQRVREPKLAFFTSAQGPALSTAKASAIVFTQATTTLAVGTTYQFTVASVEPNGWNTRITDAVWTSSDPRTATVDARGLVRGLRIGRSFIEAKSAGRSVRVRLTVVSAAATDLIASVEIIPGSDTLDAGSSVQLKAVARTADGGIISGPTVLWSSADSAIAVVSTDGLLSARAPGTGAVEAVVGNVRSRSDIRVLPASVVRIALAVAASAVETSKTTQISAVVTRSDGSIAGLDAVSLSAQRGTLSGSTYTAPASAGPDTVMALASNGTSARIPVSVTQPAAAPVPPPAPVAPGKSIALRLERFDNGSGTILVTNGVPLPPGMMRDADTASVRLVVAGVETPARVVGLRGKHKDGSLRSVLLQFMAPAFSTPLDAELQLGVTPRARRTVASPTVDVPDAVALPSSSDYLISTGLIGPTVRLDQVTGTTYMKWQDELFAWGERHWSTSELLTGAPVLGGDNYYDRVMSHIAMWARGGSSKWFRRATQYLAAYTKDDFLTWQPHNAQMDGVAAHYWLTGSDRDILAFRKQAEFMTYVVPTVGANGTYQEGRIQGRALMTLVLATQLELSVPGNIRTDFRMNASALIDSVRSAQRADGSRSVTCAGAKAFMSGILNSALMYYYDNMGADARIPGLVKGNLDYLWRTNWLPTDRAFIYQEAPYPGGCAGTADPEDRTAATDLNMLIATGYAWYGKRFNSAIDLQRAEDIVAGAVGRVYIQGSKQYNQQNYMAHNVLSFVRP